ncbi:MAG: HEAT repeat domain-containing protein, partial [Gemmatimonadota bacterium]
EALTETDDRGARHAYLDALVALGEDGRAEAKKMLDESRWWVVRNGATILGGTGTRSDVEDLTAHLAHDDARVRLQVVRALARIGGEDAAMLLLGMVDDPDPDVRASVATALGALGLDRAVKFLLERLEIETEEKVEVQILRALGALGDPGAVPSIEKRTVGNFFSKPSTTVRVAAYRALGSIGTPRATQLLQEARDDRDDEVRHAVRSVLDRREGQAAAPE